MNHRRFLAYLLLSALASGSFSPRVRASSLAFNVIYSFTNGLSPNAGVILGTDGNIHGVTAAGGPGHFGGIFAVTSEGVLTNLIWLDGTNGAAPLAPLIQDKNGNFYGTASSGGLGNNGTIFQITSASQFKLLASFNNTNGSTPLAPLLEGTNGWFYGTTLNGGSNNLGAIFRVSAAGVLSNVYSFGGSDGANPAAGLIQGNDGNLYGTTEYGGANGLGTVFRLTYAGTLSNLCSFSDHTGAFPGGLVEDASNNFYGTTISGGPAFAGTIFKLSPSGLVRTLFAFGITNGASPNSPLTAGSDDDWYGTAEEGGADGQGVLFRLNARGGEASLVLFAGANGRWPRSGVSLGPDGNLYGTTSLGGANGYGEIYQLSGFSPVILTPPANQKWASNATAQFSVTAGGSAPLSYQWSFDGTNIIAGATNATLVISHEQLTNAGAYTVVVSNSYGTASTGAVLSVMAPTLAILSAPATATNSPLTISGTAAGPNGVANVLCQLNSNGWSAAASTNHWMHWTTNVTLLPGTNTFQAQSVDPLGNPSAIRGITIFYAVLSPLTLTNNGLGSISPGFTGTNLIVDRSYTVRAVPGRGWLFSSWSGTLSSTNNPWTFVMQSNMAVQANFVTNPFVAAAGTYEGLFFTTNAVSEQSAGLLRSLVIKTSGAYSGQIVIKGLPCGFTGSFDISEQSSPTIGRSDTEGGPLVMTMALSANQVTGSNQVTGTISGTDGGGWTSTLLAEEAGPFPGPARYTMLIPPGQGAPSNGPPGDGYVLVSDQNGAVTLNGAVADGATFSQSASIVGDGDVPFYASLYGNTGLLLGWLNLNGGLTGTNLWWVKTPSSFSALYPNGFTNVVTNIPASAWTSPPADFLMDGALTISNAGLGLEFAVSITNNTVVKATNNGTTNSLTGSINPRTGLLTVTFGNGAGKATTTGYGTILQDSTNGGGYFLTKTNAGSITVEP